MVVACPAMAPGIIRLAFLSIRQDIVGCHEHAVALEAHVERQLGDGRGEMAAVGVVQLDEGVEAVLGVCIALAALEDLVRRGWFMRVFGLGPRQQVGVMVLGIAAPLLVLSWLYVPVVLVLGSRSRECMTA